MFIFIPIYAIRIIANSTYSHDGHDSVKKIIASIRAARNNITAVASSDSHSADCVGLATVEVEAEHEPDYKAILSGIKAGKVRIKNCKRTPLWVYFKHLVLKRR